MGSSILQPSFASGELAPSLAARVDLARYQTGLKLCRNFTVMPYGGIRNRPGTYFVNETKNSGQVRLIPFQFNTQQTYILEFGQNYMRVYRDGGIVVYSSGPNAGQPFELTTPYAFSDLANLNFTQSADVMTLVHPSYAPRELSRLDHDNWTLSVISFVPTIAAPTGLAGTPRSGGSGATTNFRYVVTAVKAGESQEESLPSASVTVASWDNTAGAVLSWAAQAGVDHFNVYKDNNGSGLYGFIGIANTNAFTDINIAATKTDTPPNGNNPFVGAGNYPGAVGYYQQRLCFAGSTINPQTVWMSKTGAFHNFGFSTPTKDDDSITFTIAALKVNMVKHLLPLKQLLGLTTEGEWIFGGSDAGGLTPKTVRAEIQSYNGSSSIPPIVVNNSALYVQSRGSKVSSLAYTFEDDGFNGTDLTLLSNHLFRGFSILEWAYQQIPDTIVWAVRNDGVLLGLTYDPEQQLVGWHHHDTDGFFESIATIPEGDEDSVYVVVRREVSGVTRRYVERFSSRQLIRLFGVPDVKQCYFVDCGLTYNGGNTTLETMTLTGGSIWEYPENLTLTSSNGSRFSAGDVGDQVQYAGEFGVEAVRLEIIAYVNGSTVTARPIGRVPPESRSVASIFWAFARDTFAGLSHLEGKTVSILADGNVVPPRVVSGGVVILPSPAAVVHIGLPYVSDAQTLSVNLQGEETLLNKHKAVNSVTFVVEESRGIFAGQDEAHLDEFKQRDAEDYDDSTQLLTGNADINVKTTWDSNGQVFVRQADPLPLTILGIIPEITVGGKS